MPDSNAEKRILLVEDKPEHCEWYHREFRALEEKYKITILETNVDSFVKVCKLVESVKNGEKKFDCAVVDMQIPEGKLESDGEKKVHWGVQALREIQRILDLDRMLIVTAYKGEAVPFLTPAERKRVVNKGLHIELFDDKVAKMLGLV